MIPSDVLTQWGLSGSQVKLGEGLINDTYCIDEHFVLQRINGQVFTHPERLVANYRKVFHYVYDLVPRLLPTTAGEYSFEDSRRKFWKCSVYHPSRNFQTLPGEMVYAAGQAFGLFLQRLRNCEIPLQPVLPNFHDFAHYVAELERVRSGADRQIDREQVDGYRKIVEERAPTGPRQIIHGDCKINNLLFDLQSNKVVRIVDADTLMWGYPSWDFGDLVRSLATGRQHDNRLKKRLLSVCTGFFEQFPITEAEVEQYAYAPIYMSMMLGVRFITDHILGDRYFKVDRVGENMERAEEQFKIAERFNSMYSELLVSIYSCIESANMKSSLIH